MKYSAPRGTKDILPAESRMWQIVEEKFAEVCRRFGYQEVRTPTFEQTDLFARGVGDSTDVVQKEMYNFEDKSGRPLTLRPEGTAGVARAYIEHGLASMPSPLKLYYNISAFRYEKMQKGRYREFHQLGCECFASEDATADAELISLLRIFFIELGMSHFNLEINSIGCPECRPQYRAALQDFLRPVLPELCEDCQSRFETNPLRILDCKNEHCHDLTQDAPSPLDYLCADCQEHWDQLRQLLDSYEIPYKINPRLVRGLDYYTKTVFEFVSDAVGSQGTICGGGRYDGLVELLGGAHTPSVGFALGFERLLLELENQGVEFIPYAAPDIFLAYLPEHRVFANSFCYRLRSAGIYAEADTSRRSFKSQMKHANRLGSKYLMVIGEDEVNSGSGMIKRMSDGEEFKMSFEELVQFLLTGD